jgi:protein required for attachment to host cells
MKTKGKRLTQEGAAGELRRAAARAVHAKFVREIAGRLVGLSVSSLDRRVPSARYR